MPAHQKGATALRQLTEKGIEVGNYKVNDRSFLAYTIAHASGEKFQEYGVTPEVACMALLRAIQAHEKRQQLTEVLKNG